MNIVLVTTTGLLSDDPLGALPDGSYLRVLTSADSGGSDGVLVVDTDSGITARAAQRLQAMGRLNVVLRMLVRLSPFDRGACFWRAVRRDRRVGSFVADADLFVAADRDANFACWQLARRCDVAAVSGYAAAKVTLSEVGA